MSVIARLKVWLSADTDEFAKRLNKSKKDVFGVKEAVENLKGTLGRAFAVTGLAEAGRQLARYGTEVDELREKVRRLTGMDSAELTGEVKAVADVFGGDYSEVLRTANTLHRQMGVSFDEAMTLIRRGVAAGLDEGGDFLDQLREYAPQFRSAGLSAAGLLSVLQRSVRDGVFSDKGLDAIKEATLRIREMPTATRAALEGIGLSGTEIERSLADGTATIFDVIRQVSEKLNELPESSAAVGAAIADIFGGPGEDAGLAYLQTLKDIDTEHGIVTTNLGKAQEELAESLGRLHTVSAEAFKGIGEAWTELKTRITTGWAMDLEYWTSDALDGWDRLAGMFSPKRTIENRIAVELERRKKLSEAEAKAVEDSGRRAVEVQKEIVKLNEDTSAALERKIELYEELSALQKTSAYSGEISRLQELLSDSREADKERQAAAMTERTTAEIRKKIAAYQALAGDVGVYDTATLAAYQNEISRLNGVIEKTNELANARRRGMAASAPVMEAQPSVGFTPLAPEGSPLAGLPEQLRASGEALQPIAQDMVDLSGVIGGAFEEMATGVGESIGMLISGEGGLANFAASVASTFADMAIQVGKIAIQMGVAKLAIEAALKNPFTGALAAIAAGTALVALGTAVKGALSKVADGGGTSGIGTAAYTNSYDTRTGTDAWEREGRTVDVNVTGEFRLQGNTLVAAVNKENARRRLTT